MKIYKTSAVVTAAAAAALVAPFLASAALPTTISQVTTYISTTVVSYLSGLFWAITAVFILWSAFLYLTGAGNEEKIGKAKQILIYAIIAGVVALFAQVGLRPIINSLFGM